MTSPSLIGALEFIAQAELPAPLPGATRAERTKTPGEFAAEIATRDSALVGSEILSFDAVPADYRGAILNCTLLAQLVANRSVPDRSDLDQWYGHYFDALMKLGWSIEQTGFTDLHLTGEEFKVHEAIVSVATAFLGEAPSALALVVSALKALQHMDPGQPWIRIFNRETHTETAAKFQVGVATGNAHGITIASMAFSLKSATRITQILFFKGTNSNTIFRERHARTAINLETLEGVKPVLAKKLASSAMDYILSLPDL